MNNRDLKAKVETAIADTLMVLRENPLESTIIIVSALGIIALLWMIF